MEATQHGPRSDDTIGAQQPRSGQGRLLFQALVWPCTMVVREILLEHPPQMPFVKNDEVSQALLTERANEPLHVTVALGPAVLVTPP